MAKVKPCKTCGHSRTQHTKQNNGEVTRCKYYYYARDGHNLDTGIDGVDENGHWKEDKDGRYPRHYQCLCPRWLPEEKWVYDDETDEMVFFGYEKGFNRDGSLAS